MRDAHSSELLTISEAASLLTLKPSTLRAWILRRRIPFCKVGRLVRLRRADIEALIAASVVPAHATAETVVAQ
jgi:excisionase family DNA binding protein